MAKKKAVKAKQAELESAVLELRFPDAFSIWDRAGAVWKQLGAHFPNLELVKAEPRATLFTLNDQYELAVELKRAHLKAYWPSQNLADFIGVAEKLTSVVSQQLDLTEITRVGFRVIWTIQHNSISSASDSVLRLGLLSPPEEAFGIEKGKLDRPDIRVHWENGKLGAQLQVRAEKRETKVSAPLNLTKDVPRIDKESYVVAYDVDYYTLGSIGIGQFNASKWLSQAYQAIRQGSREDIRKLSS